MNLKKTPIEDVDFILLTSPASGGQTVVKLLTGEFSGAVYSYGVVRLVEDANLGAAKLSFEFDLHSRRELEKDPLFHRWIGEILTAIITSPDAKIGK